MNKNFKKFAFTLIEALVVLAIVSIIILAISPMITKKIDKQAQKLPAENVAILKQIAELEEEYKQILSSYCYIQKEMKKKGCVSEIDEECKGK